MTGGNRSIGERPWRYVVFRCLQDGFLGQLYKYLGLLVADALNLFRRDHDLLARKPMAGLDDEVTDGPSLVIDDEIDDVANGSVAGLDMISVQSL
jgi:hypothetical protein